MMRARHILSRRWGMESLFFQTALCTVSSDHYPHHADPFFLPRCLLSLSLCVFSSFVAAASRRARVESAWSYLPRRVRVSCSEIIESSLVIWGVRQF